MSRRGCSRIVASSIAGLLLVGFAAAPLRADATSGAREPTPTELIVFTSAKDSFGGQWDLWSIEPDGSNLSQLTDDKHEDWYPSLSPDRRFVAWQRAKVGPPRPVEKNSPVVKQTRGSAPQVVVMDLRTGKVRELTRQPGSGRAPAYSPDGKRIAFLSDRGGTMRLWIMNANGSGAHAVSSTKAAPNSRPAWSANGGAIFYAGYVKGEPEPRLFQFDVADEREEPLGDLPLSEPAIAPDGYRLAAFIDDAIWIYDADGNGTELVHDGTDAYQPAWSPDSRRIVFVQNALGHSELVIYDVATGSLRPLTQPRGHKADEAPSWR